MTARSCEAAEGRERVFHEFFFESHRARIPGSGLENPNVKRILIVLIVQAEQR